MKNSKKLIVTVVVLVAIVAALFGRQILSQSKADGSIQIEVIDLDQNVLQDKNVEFMEGDTLVNLVEENFDNVTIDNGMLMTIDELTTPEDWSSYICIYVDDQMSEVGINDIVVKDGMKVSFIMTELNYEY
ncbi:DUF4430 domain-containing protein [Floccifex sp.]|uniref:DUF4430 domain-containing protein n=1 Tax=Floccifex sp. TaxID=2815810 RepID=UPI003EFCD494